MTETNELLIDDINSQIYELYTDIKTSLTQSEKEKLNNENNNKEITSTTELNVLIKYLKSYIKFLIQNKKNNNNIENNNNINNTNININNNIFYKQLESYIIRLENEIKFLMKKQFQNKIQNNSLEMKIRAYIQIEEEYEELKEKVKYEDGKFLDNDRKENEIIILRRENSNLKKEITKLEEINKEIVELKNKNKDLEKKYNDDEGIIKGLKYKINQLNNKITELEEELNNTKNNLKIITNNDINSKTNENTSNYIQINDNNNHNNSRNKIDFYNTSARKVSIEKYSLNNKKKILKGMTNYKLPTNLYNYESNKNNHNREIKTIDTNKYIVSTYNKIHDKSHKNIITPIKNDYLINTKKIKNNSVIKDENEKSEFLNKYLSGSNTNNKYIKHIKSRSLNKINNISTYKLPVANTSIKKYLQKESRHPYQHSSLNIVGINKKI